jgi:hypothetical protein
MLDLLGEVSRALSARDIPHGLIGAGALAVHGVSRSTFDLDLLVTDRRVLEAAFWTGIAGAGGVLDVRIGDDADPLAGVVRLSRPGSRSVDVVVGRSAWQAETLDRAGPRNLGAVSVPVVAPADLILLKLFAGGPQDAWDVEQLLALLDRPALVAEVEGRVSRLPRDAMDLWHKIAGLHPTGQ